MGADIADSQKSSRIKSVLGKIFCADITVVRMMAW